MSTGNEFIDAYRRMLEERQAKHARYLAEGKAEDFAQYQRVVGKINGVAEALDILKQCLDGHRRDEDDE